MNEQLKRCSICGLHVELVSAKTYPNGERSPSYIKCKRCNYHIAGYEDKDVISQWNTRSAIRKEFCPNCEAETPCTHEAELFVCDICGEDFAKYIVSRKASVPDVSTTQDVLIDIKTRQSVENTNPDYYKQEQTRIAELEAEVTKCHELQDSYCDRIAQLEKEIARRDEELLELNNKAVFIKFENEDELPAEIKDDVYSAMFECSHVDGVRLFPYIEENGQKYFLVMLKEVV